MLETRVTKLPDGDLRIRMDGYIDVPRSVAAQIFKYVLEEEYQKIVDKYLKYYHPIEKIYL